MTRYYAQIIFGKIHAVFATDTQVETFSGGVLMIDITDREPRPEPGWLYRPDEDILFAPPDPTIIPDPPSLPAPTLKTRYTHREFILRLGPEYAKIERVRDENNAKPPSEKNYDMARLFRLYDEAEWIGLDDPSLAEAMQAFVGLGLMTQERATEILTPNEPPHPGDPV